MEDCQKNHEFVAALGLHLFLIHCQQFVSLDSVGEREKVCQYSLNDSCLLMFSHVFGSIGCAPFEYYFLNYDSVK